MPLTKDEIKQGLRDLGVEGGMVLMVHSSLSALGRVEGGADTVIDALIEVAGPFGTVMMPAMGGAPVFDVNETPSNVGTITDRFWRRPETIRSIHPTHSAAGFGPLAEQLLADHVGQPTAIGPDSPWGRIAKLDNGYLLFIGCDQDRNTLLHTAEDIVEGAYLQTIVRDYYDADRRKQTAVLERFPGPHRDFIQLDRLFAQADAMRVGRIGNAVCRLMKASEILRLAVEALQADPAAVLCDNPHCMDCVKQRAAIKRARLAEEEFTLSGLLTAVFPPDEIGQALWEIQAEGIETLEVSAQQVRSLEQAGPEAKARFVSALTTAGCSVAVWPCELDWSASADERRAALLSALEGTQGLAPRYLKLSPWLARDGEMEAVLPRAVAALADLAQAAADHNMVLLIENHPAAVWRDATNCADVLGQVNSEALRLSFNPRHFAHVGENPFLRTWSRGKLKRFTAQLMVADGCGRPGWPAETVPGRGQGEVKEIISIVRCRSFAGLMTLVPGNGFTFGEAAAGFWRCLDAM
ncbi:AAC(3) family N-acetyltransferase [bacterium]|nr:AAC(3) family N-acetyltransferase [bacterium]